MGGNAIQFDYTIIATLFIFIVFVISVVFFVFAVYLIVNAIRFFKRKAVTDKELLQKLDELIRLQSQQQSDK